VKKVLTESTVPALHSPPVPPRVTPPTVPAEPMPAFVNGGAGTFAVPGRVASYGRVA
jgi:hypothetical protein